MSIERLDFMGKPLPRRWGRWRLSEDDEFLEFYRDGDLEYIYEIKLQLCRCAADVFMWAFQISEKTWAKPEDLGNLVYAMLSVAGERIRT